MKRVVLVIAGVVVIAGAQIAAYVFSGGDVDLFGSIVLGMQRLLS